MDISIYFDPVETPDYQQTDAMNERRIGDAVLIHTSESGFPELENCDLAIIGIGEERNAIRNEGCANAPDDVRKYLYRLYQNGKTLRIADLGNVRPGNSVDDTYFAVSSIVSELIFKNIVPIIIGGSQDLTYANYKAYEYVGRIINLVAIDNSFDLGTAESSLNSRSYLSKIILHQPNFLFNYTNIGYQSYFVDKEAIKLMTNLYFDIYRLGLVRSNLEEVEPMVRNADMVSFDISAIRQSDAPGNPNSSPNGFYGEEACQIVRYAGLSDKVSSIGFYEINPMFDRIGQTSHLVAQMIWYFIEGFYNRKDDNPLASKKDYKRYIVTFENNEHEIQFFKSRKTDRWWMKVPINESMKSKYERHYLVPCSYKDYEVACTNEIPERWWQAYQKLQ